MTKKNQTRKKVWTISSIYVKFCMSKWLDIHIEFELYQIFVCQNDKISIKIFELYQVFVCQNGKIFIKIFELYQFIVWQNVSMLLIRILKSIFIKIGSISFSISDMPKSHYLLGCHAIGINSSLIFFKVLCVFKIYYAKPKVWQYFYRLTKKLSWLDWKLKQYAWQKSFFK